VVKALDQRAEVWGSIIQLVMNKKLGQFTHPTLHPTVMGTWWNDKGKFEALAAENALHSSKEDETVQE
jgi:hypothetical protein